MASPDVAPLLAKEFVSVKIDLDRAPRASDLAKRYQTKEEGLPWIAIIDADGREIANATGPEGNVGFPAKASEYAHFKTMLDKAKRYLTDADIAALIASLEAANKK
ncbi:MAG: hypothetical protein NTV05_15915 [Acidobacteria bacterium]|nr:hypothetical protein [Acidobacteriota bacterium]